MSDKKMDLNSILNKSNLNNKVNEDMKNKDKNESEETINNQSQNIEKTENPSFNVEVPESLLEDNENTYQTLNESNESNDYDIEEQNIQNNNSRNNEDKKIKLNQNSLTKNKGEKTIDENNSNNNSKYNQVIDKISDNLGVLNPEETKDYSKITSKVVVEDKANNSTINDNEEIFKNYKSDFDGIDNKILDKEITQNVEKIEKKENIKKGITKKENIKTKPKYTKQIIGVIIALLIVFLPTYYFKDEILNYFSPKNNIINDNNNIDDKEILTNTGELITKTGSNILNEQEIKEIINHIENTDNTYTKEQIDKLIKEKIIEIYLKKQIKNLY